MIIFATIVAHVLESVQQGCRERGSERNSGKESFSSAHVKDVPNDHAYRAVEHESRRLTNPHPLAKIVIELMAPR